MARRILQTVAGLVGEFAEVDLPAVAGDTEHVNVGARAPDFFLAGLKHHHFDGGVFKADAVDCVMQLYVHTQVITVELEFVAGLDAAVFVDVEL